MLSVSVKSFQPVYNNLVTIFSSSSVEETLLGQKVPKEWKNQVEKK